MTSVPRLKAPLVLIHGLAGFGRVRLGQHTLLSYFPGIVDLLEKPGNRILVPTLAPFGSVRERAVQLKAFLQRETPGEPVHLFAHSMGGLDARAMISSLGMADRVLSLTTLGTPHQGTSFADWGVRRLERFIRPFFNFLGLPVQAFLDLTRPQAARFNALTPDMPGVRYFSVAGRFTGRFRPEWIRPQRILQATEGDNDGVVSVASARHGEAFDLWEADHLALVNWPGLGRGSGIDPLIQYAPLVQRLADFDF